MASGSTVFLPILFAYLAIYYVHGRTLVDGDMCVINVKKGMDKENPPLVVRSGKGGPAIVYPSPADPGNLVLRKGEELGLACPGRSNQKSTDTTEQGVILVKERPVRSTGPVENVVCLGRDKFRIGSASTDFESISCEEKPRASYNAIMREVTGAKCLNGERFEIGYDLAEAGFVRTIDLCHNRESARTLWAHGVVQPVNQDKFRYSGPGSKSFKAGSLYEDIGMSKAEPYNLNIAYHTLQEILGKRSEADKFLSPKTADRKFLARGHLIANADKIYKSEQESTYFYANAAPMWQQVNANPGNWYFVEEYVRFLAYHKKRQLDIWAGGIGVLQIEGKPFYLHPEDAAHGHAGIGQIPVPQVIFKVVVDKALKEAIVFLVINNPYLDKAEAAGKEFTKCQKKPLCDKVNEHHDGAELGYMYCCGLSDFYKKNHAELGLEDLKEFLSYKDLELLTHEKNQKPQAII